MKKFFVLLLFSSAVFCYGQLAEIEKASASSALSNSQGWYPAKNLIDHSWQSWAEGAKGMDYLPFDFTGDFKLYKYDYKSEKWIERKTKVARLKETSSFDGIAPNKQTIQNNTYPFIQTVYAVTTGNESENAKKFIEWILSPQGQELAEKTGY